MFKWICVRVPWWCLDFFKEPCILRRLLEHQFFMKTVKCEFDCLSTTFLGYIIATGSISMDPKMVKAIVEWLPLENRKELQHFLGFANFYQHFRVNPCEITTGLATDHLRFTSYFQNIVIMPNNQFAKFQAYIFISFWDEKGSKRGTWSPFYCKNECYRKCT